MADSLAMVVAVLLLTSHAWLEPLVILLVAAGAVLQSVTSYTFTDGSAMGESQAINSVFQRSEKEAIRELYMIITYAVSIAQV
ncbi:MAG: hypothetical protein IJ153_11105 [Clostridia bacterium]|nr:hypothetical protein [Clostridia bacterium]MBQ9212235.1 hypothetical protein [Clostridia bacterium]